jgi:leucyl aminopeptidase
MGYGKKSVEILNTDAEGRVALAGGISYASDNGANTIIDAATLTGACLVALGEEIAAVITKDEDLARRFRDSYEKTEEKFWPLPFEEKYLADMKSEVADLRNIGKTRWGGTITAGLFLSEFVGEGINYMHLDIAGPAMLSKAVDFYNAGGSGFGVQALAHFIKSGNLFK